MKEYYNLVKKYIKKLGGTGFFSIVVSDTLVKIVSFLGGMVLVRVLSKNDYGIYSYVMNCMGFLLILGDMGTGIATLQFTQENYKNELKFKAYCAYGLKLTVWFSFLPMICILTSPLYYPYAIEGTKNLVLLLFAWPFINSLNTFFQTNLRAHLDNNKFSALNIITIIVHYVVLLPMSLEWGVLGAVLSNYGYGIITLLISIYLNKNKLYIGKKYYDAITKTERKQFFKLSIPSQLNAMIGQIMLLIDIFMISLFFGNSEIIASYKVATTIPSACSFIPISIVVYAMPYFARNINAPLWIKKSYKKLIILSFGICFLIAFGGIVTAPWIISLVFGKEYMDAVFCYRILLVGFIFSGGLQIPSVNAISTQRKVCVNLAITIFSGILNVVLDIVGIRQWGSLGAAMATTIVSVVSGMTTYVYFKIYMYKMTDTRKEHKK